MSRKEQRQKDKLIYDNLFRQFLVNDDRKKCLILGATNSGKSTFNSFLDYNNVVLNTKANERMVMGYIFRCISFAYEMLKDRLFGNFSNLQDSIRKCAKSRTISSELINFMRHVRDQEQELLLQISFNVRYMNNIKYFFSEEFIKQLESSSEFTSFTELIRVKIPRNSYSIKEIEYQPYEGKAIFIDPSGLKGEPRKWISQFEDVDYVYYFISLADYMLTDEINNKNCLKLAIESFMEVKQFFSTTIIFLFLTKIDEFEMLLNYYPFNHYFPEYLGDNSKEQTIQYIESKCDNHQSRTRCSTPVYIHAVNMTDITKFRYTLSETFNTCNATVL